MRRQRQAAVALVAQRLTETYPVCSTAIEQHTTTTSNFMLCWFYLTNCCGKPWDALRALKRKTYFPSCRADKQPKGSVVKRGRGKEKEEALVSSSCFPVNFHFKYSCHKSFPWPGGNVQSTLLIETAIIRWQHLLFVFVTFRPAIVQIIKTKCLPTAKQATVAENLLMMPANRSYLQLPYLGTFQFATLTVPNGKREL